MFTCLELATYLKVVTTWVFSMQSMNVHQLWKSWLHSGSLANKISGPGRLQIYYELIVKRLPYWASLVAQMVKKNLPGIQETWVQSLDWGYPLEKRMVTQSSILAGKILWTEEPGGLQSMGSQRGGHDLVTDSFIFIFHIRW